jgi:hypothetical protein
VAERLCNVLRHSPHAWHYLALARLLEEPPLRCAKLCAALARLGHLVEVATGTYTLAATTTLTLPQRMLQIVAHEPDQECSVDALAEALDEPKPRIARTCSRLARDGRLVWRTFSVYALPREVGDG